MGLLLHFFFVYQTVRSHAINNMFTVAYTSFAKKHIHVVCNQHTQTYTHTHAHARTHQPVKTQQPPPAEPPNTAQKCKHHGNGAFVHCANARTEKHYRYGVCVHLPPHALFPFGSGGKSARIGITLSSSCVAVTVAVMYVCLCVCVCVHSRK